MYTWPVMKLCEKQLRDVNPLDVLNDGLYRRCNTYKGGGGYDKFPAVFEKRTGYQADTHEQFVVQLKGCPLRCPYCYVTRDGVSDGECISVSTDQLVKDFVDSKLPVFHLMGGAPALYIAHWKEIINNLNVGTVFHSDLLLLEGDYNIDVIDDLASYINTLYAVSIKGCDEKEFKRNTGIDLNTAMFWNNLDKLVETKFPFYLTYTGMSEESIVKFKKDVINRYGNADILQDSFAIQLIKYEALN